MKHILIEGLKNSVGIIFGLPWLAWLAAGSIGSINLIGNGELTVGIIMFILWGISAGVSVAFIKSRKK